MRLLNAYTLELESFWDHRSRPVYAVLSHTWGDDEVTFSDLQSSRDDYLRKPSWKKIQGACEQTLKSELSYIWIDTLCIDKSSSAELSEAINSMFVWYHGAKICYAYLADVRYNSDELSVGSLRHLPDMEKSRWFTRGWTLQELLAPQSVRFFDDQWQSLGDRESLAATIEAITDIDQSILKSPETIKIRKECVATRLSWASKRQTTRVEDIAYCLLGLFEVNMPLIYGEGERAFARLQEEIMKTTSDQSIFAWQKPSDGGASRLEAQTGLLAPSPSYFADLTKLTTFRDWTETNPRFELTNFGVSIELPLLQLNENYHVAILNCARDPPSRVTLLLCAHPLNAAVFSRVHDCSLPWPAELAKAEGIRRRIFVSEPREVDESAYESIVSGSLLRMQLTEQSLKYGYRLDGCLYDTDAGNGLGLPGWCNRHWERNLREEESECLDDWRRLFHDASWCSTAKLQIPGDPKVLVVAMLITHVWTSTRFIVLIGTGSHPALLQLGCHFPPRDFDIEKQDLAQFARELRCGFDFDSEARYGKRAKVVYSHGTFYEFKNPHGGIQDSKHAGSWKRSAPMSQKSYYVCLEKHEEGNVVEIQLEVMGKEALNRASSPVRTKRPQAATPEVQFRFVVGQD